VARFRPIRAPVPWTNQDLDLFHGTLQVHVAAVMAGVNVNLGRTNTDFGRGFYTTTSQRQAISWAWQLAQRQPGSVPAVVRFRVRRDDLARLDSVWFVRWLADADDYWSLVFYCHRGGSGHGRGPSNNGWYDVAIGPVAGPWFLRKTLFGHDQVSFHTDTAATVLDGSLKARVL
jgi:hypothetical protein